MKNQISIDYFPEGDMLSITFGESNRKGNGFELNEYIYLRLEKKTYQPLGLTFLIYSKLIKLGEVPLSFWNDFPKDVQKKLLKVLQSYPVNLFLSLKKETINILPISSFPDTSIKKLIAA
ncbi:MAG: hypothetical protein GXO75_15780 [Calditrichaeota bacterium]|nr:hypothetical protein [Calditrichota bacterium]